MFVLMEQYLLPEKRITYWKLIWHYFPGLFPYHFSSIQRGKSNYKIDKLVLQSLAGLVILHIEFDFMYSRIWEITYINALP